MGIMIIVSAALFILCAALAALFFGAKGRKEELERLLNEANARISSFDRVVSELEGKIKDGEKKISEMSSAAEKQEKVIKSLKDAMNSDSFDGRFPICSNCKDIRDENGFWHPIEEYLQNLATADFSHSLCPECAKKLYPDMFKDGNKPHTLTWK